MKQTYRKQKATEEIRLLIDGLDIDDKLSILKYILESVLDRGVKLSIDVEASTVTQTDKELTTPQLARILRRKAEELRSTRRKE